MILLYTPQVNAQHGSGPMENANADRPCTLMSDTVIIWLDLTRDQLWSLEQSSARCMNACAKSELNPFGRVDVKAVAKHDQQIKKILSTVQYTEWVWIRDAVGSPNKVPHEVKH